MPVEPPDIAILRAKKNKTPLPSGVTTVSQWLSTIRFPERIILFTLLVLGCSLWGFIEVADEVVDGGSQHFDEWALSSLRDPNNPALPIGPPWLGDVARDVTSLGGGSVIAMITAAVVMLLVLQRKTHLMWLVLASVTGGAIGSALLKEMFDRDRPSVVAHLARVTSASFPSGHSMISAVTYLTLGALLARSTKDPLTKGYYIFIAVSLVLMIGLSRIYLGVHYPTDVLAGWCGGVAWALFCAIIARWLQHRGKVEPASSTPGVKP